MELKIENRGRRVSIHKGTESVIMDINYEEGAVFISATDRSGGYTVASLKFEKDEVVRV
jgi:hypothetical protein